MSKITVSSLKQHVIRLEGDNRDTVVCRTIPAACMPIELFCTLRSERLKTGRRVHGLRPWVCPSHRCTRQRHSHLRFGQLLFYHPHGFREVALTSANVYIKRTAPPEPGRGQITLTPGDWTNSGTWIATESPHEGEPLFSARSGTYSIKNRIVTLLGADLKTAVLIKDWAKDSMGTGPGETFNSTENTSMNIAWKLSPWPPN